MGPGEELGQREKAMSKRRHDGRNDREQVLNGEIGDDDLVLRHHARDTILCAGLHDVEG